MDKYIRKWMRERMKAKTKDSVKKSKGQSHYIVCLTSGTVAYCDYDQLKPGAYVKAYFIDECGKRHECDGYVANIIRQMRNT